ncbi:hypothetical protein Z947_2271 [Sulfitobacter geojensis]|nr:hypothetical protein Z947_2271 [Sulfitobacter geojensis]
MPLCNLPAGLTPRTPPKSTNRIAKAQANTGVTWQQCH